MGRYLWLLSFLFLYAGCQKPVSFRFALFSDTHVSEYGTGTIDLRLAVRDVNMRNDLQFVIVSGDITDTNTGNNLITAKRILDSLDVPYYIIPGNHDTKWSGSAGENFDGLWGKDRFSFEHEGYRFIGFHQGPVLRMDDGHIPLDIMNWLKAELKSTGKEQPVILVMHYPLTSAVDNWDKCLEIIKEYNIQAIFHGHGHRNRMTHYQGIPAIMGRSTLRAGAEKGGYTVISVQTDSIYAFEKLTGGSLSSPWASFSLKDKIKIEALPDSLMPDLSINYRYPTVQIAWLFKSGHTMTASPVYDESHVYVGNASGNMYALDRHNGEIRWISGGHGSIYGTAALKNNNLIFTAADSNIYCLDKADGNLLWKVSTGNALVSVPAIEDDIAYVGSSDSIFRALDIRYGEILWEFKGVTGYVETKPILYENMVIFGAWDGRLYSLDKNTGEPIWIWEVPNKNPLYSPAACWPVAAHEKIFIASPDRFIRAIDAKKGLLVWQDTRWKFRETVGLSEKGHLVFARSMTDSVVAFDSRKPEVRVIWAENFFYGYDIAPSMPVESDGTLFWGTKNGNVIACDAETGKLKWAYRYENYLINTVAPVSADQLLFTNIDGDVILLSNKYSL